MGLVLEVNRLVQGKLHAKRRAAARAGTLRFDSPAMHFDDAAGDREAEAEPAVLAREPHIGLAEPLEHVRQEACLDAAPGIGDHDFRRGLAAPGAYLHRAT